MKPHWPQPHIQRNPNFEPGGWIDDPVKQKSLHEECQRIFRMKSENAPLGTPMRLHRHQVDAIHCANQGANSNVFGTPKTVQPSAQDTESECAKLSFHVGSLIKARGREWVVLPESADDFLIVRPLGGTDAEVAGIDTNLESVEPARFDLPDPAHLGDFQSCRLLRDAIRLGFRSSAGPFRSFGKIAVEPRPYQLVPLLMALKLDPVRLLIADDVGIGKTVEASPDCSRVSGSCRSPANGGPLSAPPGRTMAGGTS